MSLKNKVATAVITGMLVIATPFVAVQEGLVLHAERDIGGVWTWCYGETEGQKPSKTFTEQECSLMLKAKLYVVGMAVWSMIDTPMTTSRWAGLTSFTYNVGINAFRNSTLRRKLNDNDPQACNQLRRWTFVKGKDCKLKSNGCGGIVTRREKELKLCQS